MFTAIVVANELVKRAKQENVSLTPMKLQKILFFVYGRYLAQSGTRLFFEPFAVWQYGPVIESVYYEFKGFGAENITKYATDAKGDAYFPDLDSKELQDLKQSINDTWCKYKNYGAMDLVNLTHEQNTPWWIAKQKKESHIDDNEIKKYFEMNSKDENQIIGEDLPF